MAGPLSRGLYGAAQLARVAFFGAHYAAGLRMAGSIRREGEERFAAKAGPARRGEIIKALRALFAQDLAHVEAGHYPMPRDLVPELARWARGSRAYFADVRAVAGRRRAHGHSEVATDERRGRYPRYYLQNFHYQTDGWLSADSARRYDFQVETLFAGAADAMRRAAIPPIARALAGRDQRGLRLLDIGTGTGRFLTFLKDAFPRLDVTALDLSPDYLEEAARALSAYRDWRVREGAAEALPFADEHFDAVTAVYLFHELPPKIRAAAAREIARVLKPGGLFVLADSLQTGDTPELDALIELFPVAVHEPYYAGYAREDLTARFGAAGLVPAEPPAHAFLTKVMAFRKP